MGAVAFRRARAGGATPDWIRRRDPGLHLRWHASARHRAMDGGRVGPLARHPPVRHELPRERRRLEAPEGAGPLPAVTAITTLPRNGLHRHMPPQAVTRVVTPIACAVS